MKRRKRAVSACMLLTAASALAGCGSENPAKEQAGSTAYIEAASAESAAQEAITVTVKVTAVDGATVRGCAGRLDAPEMKEQNGGMPSDKQAVSTENETEAEAVSAGNSIFTESGLTVTFTLAEDAVITVECQKGNGEGKVEDIAAGAVLEVTLDEKYQAVAVAVKKLDTEGGTGSSPRIGKSNENRKTPILLQEYRCFLAIDATGFEPAASTSRT